MDVLNELESLKPNFLRQVNEVNRGNVAQLDMEENIPYNSEDFASLPSAKKQNSIVSLYPKKEQVIGQFEFLLCDYGLSI